MHNANDPACHCVRKVALDIEIKLKVVPGTGWQRAAVLLATFLSVAALTYRIPELRCTPATPRELKRAPHTRPDEFWAAAWQTDSQARRIPSSTGCRDCQIELKRRSEARAYRHRCTSRDRSEHEGAARGQRSPSIYTIRAGRQLGCRCARWSLALRSACGGGGPPTGGTLRRQLANACRGYEHSMQPRASD